MNEMTTLVGVCLAGGVLGGIFFGGLWWTVRKGVASPRPALWFLVSLWLRMGLTLAGFYVVSSGQGQRLLVCLLGFIAARFIVTRLIAPSAEKQSRAAREAAHAP